MLSVYQYDGEKVWHFEENEIASKNDVKLNSKFSNSIEYLFLREQINTMELFKINYPKDHIMRKKYEYIFFLKIRFKLSFYWVIDEFEGQIIKLDGLWCLMPLSTILQLYRGVQFYWWRKQEYPRKTTTQLNWKLSNPFPIF